MKIEQAAQGAYRDRFLEALGNAREAFLPIRHSGHNEHTGGTYATLGDMMRATSEGLRAAGFSLVFDLLDFEPVPDLETKKGSIQKGYLAKVQARLLHPAGQLATKGAGVGYDAGDKGLLIAQAHAQRKALQYLLGLDVESRPPGQQGPRKAPQKRPWPSSDQVKAMQKTIGAWCERQAEARGIAPPDALAEIAEGIDSLRAFGDLKPNNQHDRNLMGILERAHAKVEEGRR